MCVFLYMLTYSSGYINRDTHTHTLTHRYNDVEIYIYIYIYIYITWLCISLYIRVVSFTLCVVCCHSWKHFVVKSLLLMHVEMVCSPGTEMCMPIS